MSRYESGKRKPPSESAALLHYCRTCEQEFETEEGESAHLQALAHHIKEHDHTRQYVRCSSFCELRAQSEEIAAGYRKYGPGAPKGTPTKTYAELFPMEED
jgi:hypothetical protein